LQAANFDPEDEFGFRGKNLKRQGLALYNLKQWKAAATYFAEAMKADKSIANDQTVRAKYADAKAKADKESAKEKKTWQGAFAKMKDEPSPSNTADGGSGSSSSDGPSNKERGVRFVSPEKPTAGDSGSASSAVKASPGSGDGSEVSGGGGKRTLYAGHTPHPGKGGKAKKRIITGTSDDEDQEEEAGDENEGSAGGAGTATLVKTEEEEEEGQAPSALQKALPWIVGAGALLTLGVIAKRKGLF
jgi:hypothetical protein